MRLARGFSTSLRLTKQALYQPYSPPLNQEEKKALRKLLMATQPRFNEKFNKDAEWLLDLYSVSNDTLERRKSTILRVKSIVQAAFGQKFSVLDRSLYRYAKDCECAPLELSILDTSKPTGFSPDQLEKRVSAAYDYQAIARLLQDHGFSGSFVSGDAMRNQPPHNPNAPLMPFTERGPYPTNHPWPNYTPYPTLYLTYPPVLWAEPHARNSDLMSFFLSPPVPTHAPLLRLLKEYASMGENYRDLITFIFLWTRSMDVLELTPTCVALMVIGWLQVRGFVPSLQNPKDNEDLNKLAEKDEGVWFTSSRPVSGNEEPIWYSTRLETGFSTPKNEEKPLNPKKMAPMVHDFFGFWAGKKSSFIHVTQYLSVREGSSMSRKMPLEASRSRLVMKQDDNDIERGLEPDFNDQPRMWQTQPIIVQDPFVPHYNHVQSVSRIASNYFSHWCSVSERNMGREHPAWSIFGTKLPGPLTAKTQRAASRSHSTITVSQEIQRMYQASLPPQSVLEARGRLISRVQNVISLRFGSQYTVECFGSTRYGVSTPTSDLDLVVIDPGNVDGFHHPVNPNLIPAIYNIWGVARAISHAGFVQVATVPKAQVPIVKFRDPISDLECDLNVNEQLGLWNTRLVARYCDLAPKLLRPLIVAIKRWAKSHGLNQPSGRGPASFSSYALVLMLIGYLQIRGVLPILQAGLPPISVEDAKQGVFWVRGKDRTGEPCDVRFNRFHGWTPQVEISLEDALSGWFIFWAEFKCDEHVLYTREGRLAERITMPAPKKAKKKKKKIKETGGVPQIVGGVSTLDTQQLRREAGEEVAVDAFAEQDENEDEEAEDDEYPIVGTVEDADPEHTKDPEQRHDSEKLGPIDPSAELQTQEALEVAGQSAKYEVASNASYTGIHQPSKWRNHAMIVIDPFLPSKNVCGNISKAIILRFRAECRVAAQKLDWGAGLGDLMGEALPPPPISVQGHERPGPQGRGRGAGAGRATWRARHGNDQQGNKQDARPGESDRRHPRGTPSARDTLTATAGPSKPVEIAKQTV